MAGLPQFFCLDCPDRLRSLANTLRWTVPIAEISAPGEAAALFDKALPVLPLSLPETVEPGILNVANAAKVLSSIEMAVDFVIKGDASAVVTNPIHKSVLYEAGFRHPGHTEFLAELAGAAHRSVMMLACDQLRVVPITVHVSLRRATEILTRDLILETARITHAGLKQDFGIPQPRLAFAGLNPHAGEDGSMGDEELKIIGPAMEELRSEGIECIGPLSADTMFHEEARAQYDVALCMYHDQALIPIKTLDFHGGTNITIGLPFIRTSPDHGTALGLAGSGNANPTSFFNALKQAASMAAQRNGK
ncbi:4-hydroxythreonine-4-phosphate dehydrogenase [Aestuariispira insulae]|uniref:4-hydroxythreonine-4-phosphate dehydrogenase n=2 Tax=Aestuariispira insulae TaxID=1461337 RepID=A0A3D9HVS5_9PROT|nr:4-hydroxythreonine-4-phosphate dehydrogenase [Aestuariispira insulae]